MYLFYFILFVIEKSTTLHIGGIASQAASASVKAVCQECGRLLFFKSLVPAKSIAFSTFERREEAERAKARLDGTSYESVTLQVKWAKGRIPFLTFDNNTGEGTVEGDSGLRRPDYPQPFQSQQPYNAGDRGNQQRTSKWDM